MPHIQDRKVPIGLSVCFLKDHQTDIIFDRFNKNFGEKVVNKNLNILSALKKIYFEAFRFLMILLVVRDSFH